MQGLGTDDTTLMRVIVTKTEIDMQYIKPEYYKKYKKSLNDAFSPLKKTNYTQGRLNVFRGLKLTKMG